MDLTEEFRQALVKTGKMALEFCAAAGDPFFPKLLAEMEGVMTVMTCSEPDELAGAASYLIALGVPVTGLCLTVDSYHFVGKGSRADAERYAGKLQEMFDAGDERVSEALFVHIAVPDRSLFISAPYVRSGHTIEWQEEIVVEEGIEGRFSELLQHIIKETHSAWN